MHTGHRRFVRYPNIINKCVRLIRSAILSKLSPISTHLDSSHYSEHIPEIPASLWLVAIWRISVHSHEIYQFLIISKIKALQDITCRTCFESSPIILDIPSPFPLFSQMRFSLLCDPAQKRIWEISLPRDLFDLFYNISWMLSVIERVCVVLCSYASTQLLRLCAKFCSNIRNKYYNRQQV